MVGVDPSKLVGLLNDLEADGLIVRKRDTEDRRRHIVEVSAKGSARLEDAKKAAAAVEEELLAGLDADQRAELLVLLAQVADSSGIFEGCVERLGL
jgi:DNA-binding MarR family transcriptional regulator